jgi:hypothetical protein
VIETFDRSGVRSLRGVDVPLGRHHDPVEGRLAADVVGDPPVAVDDRLVVHPPQQTGVVEVVQLGRAVDARGLSSASMTLPSTPVMVTRFADLSKRTVRPVASWSWRKYCFCMLASTGVDIDEVGVTLELPERRPPFIPKLRR